MKRNYVFPFCAVLGQDAIKSALIFNVVNPSIGGVLISGEKGTAKSTLVRGLANIMGDMEVVELPLNVTEDRLIGTIDMEKAIKEGKKSFEPGILRKADGNFLYADEVNLLSEYIVNCLLEVSASQVNVVEREGISCSHKSSFVLVGTMNPEEGALRPQFLDRFGLYVQVRGSSLVEERKEIIKRRLEYEGNPGAYVEKWRRETEKLSQKITSARKILPQVGASYEILKLAAGIALEGNCAGHRAELALIETAKALAAFDGRKAVAAEDLKQAAEFALPHRMRKNGQPQVIESKESQLGESPEEENPGRDEEKPGEEEKPRQDEPDGLSEEKERKHEDEGRNTPPGENSGDGSGPEEGAGEEPDGQVYLKPLEINPPDKRIRKGSGKRSRTKTGPLQGRYVRYTFLKGKLKDLAFDATLRAAAPYQASRKSEAVAFTIRPSDFREKVREKHTGSTILFIVDASGSMGVRQRMKAVKGAILSILNDAYQKRDKVGMIAFRKDSARILLGITRSVDLAEKNLRDLPTGGKTPLAEGLLAGYQVIKAALLKDPDMIPLVVLVTDGRANISIRGGSPIEEAVKMAGLYGAEGIRSLVIDTEKGFVRLGLAEKIAEAMGSDYIKLDSLTDEEVEYAVRSIV